MSNKPPIEVPQGAIRLNTDSQKLEFFAQDRWYEMATDTPNLSTRQTNGRGIFMGGHDGSANRQDRIDFITIATAGDAVDFGNLTDSRSAAAAIASNTRGMLLGGSSPGNVNTVDFVTISITSEAIDFGDLTAARHWTQPASNQTRGLAAGGNPGTNVIDFCTIASTGDFQDFGDLTNSVLSTPSVSANSSNQSPTRGFFGGGTPTNTNHIEFVTITTLGNSQDFGDSTTQVAREARGSSSTRALIIGGVRPEPSASTIIDYFTMSSLGNAVQFGDASASISNSAGCSDCIRVAFAHGNNPSNTNSIDYINIATGGDSLDFGDLSLARNHLGGCSNGHGGL